MRTRIKICGIRTPEHARAAADAGADAVGLVFYGPSPRAVDADAAARIVAALPPFVATVGLFVNAPMDVIHPILAKVPLDLLQFHGDESPEYCARSPRPYVRGVRMAPETDLLEFERSFSNARALLLDAHVTGTFGGTGQRFDWSMLEARPPVRPYILSGGLTVDNVGVAVRRLRPWAVDVSSGVESERGIKDVAKIRDFIQAVRDADAQSS